MCVQTCSWQHDKLPSCMPQADARVSLRQAVLLLGMSSEASLTLAASLARCWSAAPTLDILRAAASCKWEPGFRAQSHTVQASTLGSAQQLCR